jgi:hypothetical protein
MAVATWMIQIREDAKSRLNVKMFDVLNFSIASVTSSQPFAAYKIP